MYWVEVDGYPMPRLISGHPALDLCNTRAGWGQPWHPKNEWIRDYDRLAVWAKHAALTSEVESARLRRAAARTPRPAERVLARTRRLRRDLYKVALEPGDQRSFRRVASLVEEAAAHLRFELNEDGAAEWRFAKSVGLELPLYEAARAAESLLRGPDRRLIARCPGDDCGWLFINRQGRRKWCSMATCGNRAKVRAHAARAR